MAKMLTPSKYSTDNVLGWSEKEFNDLICEMVNLRISQGLNVNQINQQIWFRYGNDWLKERWGLDCKKLKEDFLKEKIRELENELEDLKNERK